MTNIEKFITKKIEENGDNINHPMLDEAIYFYAIDYIKTQQVTSEDMEILKNLNIEEEDLKGD